MDGEGMGVGVECVKSMPRRKVDEEVTSMVSVAAPSWKGTVIAWTCCSSNTRIARREVDIRMWVVLL